VADRRKLHNGIAYFSVGAAATFLDTNTAKVKTLMSDGTLDWCNLRINVRIFITAVSLIKYKRQLVDARHAAARGKHP
jgi:hypothetical protein